MTEAIWISLEMFPLKKMTRWPASCREVSGFAALRARAGPIPGSTPSDAAAPTAIAGLSTPRRSIPRSTITLRLIPVTFR